MNDFVINVTLIFTGNKISDQGVVAEKGTKS